MNPLLDLFAAKEETFGLPSGYLARTAEIESSMNPKAQNPNSSAGGLFQFIDSTARQYGLQDRFDPMQATEAAARLARDNAATLRRGLGREPTAGELYLAHQQGAGRALKLLRNPDARAEDVVGSAAARLNRGGGRTAGDFASLWLNKFDNAPTRVSNFPEIASAPTPPAREQMQVARAEARNPLGGLGGLGGFGGAPEIYASLPARESQPAPQPMAFAPQGGMPERLISGEPGAQSQRPIGAAAIRQAAQGAPSNLTPRAFTPGAIPEFKRTDVMPTFDERIPAATGAMGREPISPASMPQTSRAGTMPGAMDPQSLSQDRARRPTFDATMADVRRTLDAQRTADIAGTRTRGGTPNVDALMASPETRTSDNPMLQYSRLPSRGGPNASPQTREASMPQQPQAQPQRQATPQINPDDYSGGQWIRPDIGAQLAQRQRGGMPADMPAMGAQNAQGQTAPQSAPQAPQQATGGVGGFLRSEGFGNFLQALGTSLMSSPRNNPLANFGPAMAALSKASEGRQLERSEIARVQGMALALGVPEDKVGFIQSSADVKLFADAAQEEASRQGSAQFQERARGVFGGASVATPTGGATALGSQATPAAEGASPAQPANRTQAFMADLYQRERELTVLATDPVNGDSVKPLLEQTKREIERAERSFGEKYRPLITPEDRAAVGIPADDTRPYQIGPDNKVSPIGGAGVVVNTGDTTDKFYETLDGDSAKSFSAMFNAGVSARSKLGQLDRLSTLLEVAPQGGVGALKAIAGEFGINTEGLSDIQAATALINRMVPEQRQPGSGPMSDADLLLFKQSLPRILNQPGGNQIIINTLRGIAEYEVKQGEIAAAVANREISPAAARAALMELENPLSFLNEVETPAEAPQQGTVEDGYRFIGGDPADPASWERVQ